mgnify:CR=1 FL=1
MQNKKTVKLGYDVFGIDVFKHKELENLDFNYIEQDLTDLVKLTELFEKENFDSVLNTFGIKGSPLRAKTKPIDFLYPSIKVNNEIIDLWKTSCNIAEFGFPIKDSESFNLYPFQEFKEYLKSTYIIL